MNFGHQIYRPQFNVTVTKSPLTLRMVMWCAVYAVVQLVPFVMFAVAVALLVHK